MGLKQQAISVLLASGAMEECDRHPGVFFDTVDPAAVDEAKASARDMVKLGQVDFTVEEFERAIDGILENAGVECGYCAKNSESD